QKYLWNFAGDGRQMIDVLYGIRDLFEEGAASGRPVLDVTGDDVAAFAWNVLMEAQASTWMGKKAAHLNADVKVALAKLALHDAA
ncbi:MAG: DUF1048 domain-containing protein, partial [Bifidobacteriaceae bacterium]|nr:DUF1048 domain-containing protein [Bifidobacteriaceae bacterium]